VEVTFADRKIRKAVKNDQLIQVFGSKRGKKLKERLDDLFVAETLEDLKHLPGRYHELVGNKKGLWACDLDQPYRLIFKPHEAPIPTNEDGQYIWSEIKGVEIVEINDYH
jgi:proteic killer suppression protein